MGAELDMLDFRVLDAEFSSSQNRIVAVSAIPTNRLHVYDPESQSGIGVDLPLTPTCVSVSPDGLFAAVGHDGWITYVDLQAGAVLNSFAVSAVVHDVVLAGNGFAYAFPQTGQWVRIHCIELATGIETLGQGIVRQGTQAKLHPNGASIYGADNGISPSDIEKYDITGGTSQYLYDSPYHGDHAMCGDLWISEEGQRIFTRCGNVFRSSENQAEDMVYNGELSELDSIESLDHSAEAGKVLAIPATPLFGGGAPDTELQVYDDTFLDFEESQPLPQTQLGQSSYDVHGRFVFLNEAGTKAYIVGEVDASSGLSLDHGVVEFTLVAETQALAADASTVSLLQGGTVSFAIDAGAENAGREYLLLGTTNGTTPGIPLGSVVLPLNFEFGYFYYTLFKPNSALLSSSYGLLNGAGLASAQLNIPAGTASALAGTTLHHAFAVFAPVLGATFASNAEALTLEP